MIEVRYQGGYFCLEENVSWEAHSLLSAVIVKASNMGTWVTLFALHRRSSTLPNLMPSVPCEDKFCKVFELKETSSLCLHLVLCMYFRRHQMFGFDIWFL